MGQSIWMVSSDQWPFNRTGWFCWLFMQTSDTLCCQGNSLRCWNCGIFILVLCCLLLLYGKQKLENYRKFMTKTYVLKDWRTIAISRTEKSSIFFRENSKKLSNAKVNNNKTLIISIFIWVVLNNDVPWIYTKFRKRCIDNQCVIKYILFHCRWAWHWLY